MKPQGLPRTEQLLLGTQALLVGAERPRPRRGQNGFFFSRKCPFDGTIKERGLRALHGLGKQPTKGDTVPRTSGCFILRDCFIWPLPYIFSPFLLKVNFGSTNSPLLANQGPCFPAGYQK